MALIERTTSSGDISLARTRDISGNTVMIRNEGPTSGSDVNVASGGQISASASGNAIIVVGDNLTIVQVHHVLNTPQAVINFGQMMIQAMTLVF